MAREFETFTDLINWKNICPICSKELCCKIEVYDYFKKSAAGNKLFDTLQKHFTGVLRSEEEKKDLEIFFKISDGPLNIKDTFFLNFKDNKCLVDDTEKALTAFSFKMFCPHEVVGNAYEAGGSFGIAMNYEDISLVPKEQNKYVLPFEDVRVDYETYKIYNLHLEDERPNGNLIKITNDYHINKTSFSMAETNLDGTMGTWKEKRIELVGDDFFKFGNSEKIYSRVNAIFLLQK